MSTNFLKYLRENSLGVMLAVACAMLPFEPGLTEGATNQQLKDAPPAMQSPPVADEKPAAPIISKPADESLSFGNYLSGRFAESQGDAGKGAQYLRDSLKDDPDNKDTQKGLYRMLVLSGKIDEAMPLAKKLQGVKVVDDGSEFSPEMLLAVDEIKADHFEKARKLLASVPKVGFNSLLVPLMHVWIKLGLDEIKEPVDVKSMSASGHAILPHVYLNAGFIDDIAGFDKEAQKQYEAAIKDPRIEPFRAVEALADFYSRKNMDDKRRQLVSDYLSQHGDSYLSDELLLQPEKTQNKLLVDNATQGVAEVFYTVANIFYGIRAPADEVASLNIALYLRPDFPAAKFLLANTYELAQEYQLALDEYKSINPDSPYYTRGKIRAVYDDIALGHKEIALATLDKMARDQPQDVDALLAKGDILRMQNQFQDAVITYNEAVSRIKTPQTRYWLVYFSRGACYQLMGKWNQAEADMKKALELDPTQPEVLNYLGYSWLMMHQNIDEAKKMIAQAYQARPEEAHIIDSRGYAQYVSGDFSGAEEYFTQALERTPNDPTVNDHLGDTYWQLGRKTEARYQWERTLSDNPDKELEKEVHKKLKDGLEPLHPMQSKDDVKSPASPATE